MKIDSDTVPLGVRISRIMIEGKVRFIVQNRLTLQPLIAISLYEAYLSKRHASYNSVLDTLQKLSYLWCWAQLSNVDLDELLLTGEMLSPQQVNAFGFWLDQRKTLRNKSPLSPKTKNGILSCVSKSFRWFADNFYKTLKGPTSEREVFIRQYKDAISDRFSDQLIKTRKKISAEDLTEEEITKIEQFLKPENRLLKHPYLSEAQVHRDYLIWRLVIEFGLRIGEILALRLEDCPHQNQDFINIVRIEERGADYRDPRGAYAPRPKTLSRELGFILKNSPIKRLINEYTTKYRFRKVLEHGRKVSKPVFDMPAFLILNHKHAVIHFCCV